jgi:hypothetical protein
MSSTRNNNCQGEYTLQQQALQNRRNIDSYIGYATNSTTYLPGNGLLHGRMAHGELSHNGNDIEAYLFGINSTNLVNKSIPVIPRYKDIQSLSIIDKQSVIMPEPLTVSRTNRPMYLN